MLAALDGFLIPKKTTAFIIVHVLEVPVFQEAGSLPQPHLATFSETVSAHLQRASRPSANGERASREDVLLAKAWPFGRRPPVEL